MNPPAPHQPGILDLGNSSFVYSCLSGRGVVTFFSLGSEAPAAAVAPSVRVQDEPNATGPEAPGASVAAGVSMAAVAAVVLNAHVQDDADDTGRIPSIRAMLEKVLLICGEMGSGKTYRVAEYVEQGPEKPAEAGQGAG